MLTGSQPEPSHMTVCSELSMPRMLPCKINKRQTKAQLPTLPYWTQAKSDRSPFWSHHDRPAHQLGMDMLCV